MTDTHFAFEQVPCKYPLVDEAVTEWAAEGADGDGGGEDARENGLWHIEWPAMQHERTTTIAGIAYYADQWDDDATVVRLE